MRMGKIKFLLHFSILFLINNSIRAANILSISGAASPSHQVWSGVLLKELASRGHNVTALSVDIQEMKTPNLTFIHIENVYDFFINQGKKLTSMDENSPKADIEDMAKFRADCCVPAFESKGVRQLMNYPKTFKFDVVIHDFAASYCLLGFIPRFGNPPLVGASAGTCSVGRTTPTGNPQYPAFIPSNYLRTGFKMSFFVRAYNVLIFTYDNLVQTFYMLPRQNEMSRKYFGDETLDVGAISRSSVLNLVNLPPADVMYPLFQNVIPIGGMQIQPPKPVDNELNHFMSKAEKGVVYFALGTNIKSEHFSSVQVKYFLDAFARFPSYRFVWKYDPAQMKLALPKNVMIRKWMSQNDILAHPSVKVFIGHGGALSSHEAMWYGVPQLLLPFIIDQKHNAARAEERGIALQLDKDNLSTDVIVDKLDRILHNPSFQENMDAFSGSFRDQPQTPLERAVFWVEYVIRHGAGSKLRSPGQDLGFFRQMALDVVAFLVAALLAIIVILKFVLNILLSMITKTKKIKTN